MQKQPNSSSPLHGYHSGFGQGQTYFKNSNNQNIPKLFFVLLTIFFFNYQAESILQVTNITGSNRHPNGVGYIEMNLNYTKIFSLDGFSYLKIWTKDSNGSFIHTQQISLGALAIAPRFKFRLWRDGQGIIALVNNRTIQFFLYNSENGNYTKQDSKTISLNDEIRSFCMNEQFNQGFFQTIPGNLNRLYYQDNQWKSQLYLTHNYTIHQLKLIDNDNTFVYDLYDKICIQNKINSKFTYNSSNCYSIGIDLTARSIRQIRLSRNAQYFSFYFNWLGQSYYKNYYINNQIKRIQQLPTHPMPPFHRVMASVIDKNKMFSIIIGNNQFLTSYLVRYIYKSTTQNPELYDSINFTASGTSLFASQTGDFLVYGNRLGDVFVINATKPPVEPCPSQCSLCFIINVCESCKASNRDLLTNCTTCILGSYNASNQCLPCDSKCQSCNNGNECTSCKDPKTTVENGCVPPPCQSDIYSHITVTRTTQQCVDDTLVSQIPNCGEFEANKTTFSCIKCKTDSLWRINVLRDNKLTKECVLKTVIQFSGSRCATYQATGQTHTCSSCLRHYRLVPIQQNGVSYNFCIHKNAVILTSNCQRYSWNAQLGRMVCQSCSNANDSLVPLLSGKSTPLRCILTSLISSIPNCFSYRYWNGRFYCLACNVGYAFDIAKNCNECAVGYTKSTPSGNTVCTMT